MKQVSARKIAIIAMFIALLGVCALTPLGFFPIIPGVIDAAFVFLVIITVAIQVEGFWVGFICATSFGIFSCLRAWLYPVNVTAFMIQNPIVSVLPRIAIAFTAYFSFVFMKKATKQSKSKFVRKQLPSIVSAAITVITNTGLVVLAMSLGYGGEMLSQSLGTVMQWISSTILVLIFPIELLANILIVPALYTALIKYTKRR